MRNSSSGFKLAMAALFATAALLVAAGAFAQAQTKNHPVGWDRIVRPAMPKPVAAKDGGVYVPKSLGEMPTTDWPGEVIDEPDVIFDSPVNSPLKANARPARIEAVGPNVRLNNTAGDAANTTNSETSIAAWGNYLVGGWNDGLNFGVSPGNSGYAYSSDGGITWTDGGVPPVPAGSSARYEGDPVMTRDNAGNFYYANLYTPDGSASSVDPRSPHWSWSA